MNITMTWADGALALLLGVLGSVIAAYVYSKTPDFVALISRWFAQRSRKATETRLIKLQKEIEEIEKFKQDEKQYFGRMIVDLAQLQMRLAFSLIFVLLGVGAFTSYELNKADSLNAYTGWAGFGFGLGLLILAVIRNVRINRNGNLSRKEKDLREEISNLVARLQ